MEIATVAQGVTASGTPRPESISVKARVIAPVDATSVSGTWTRPNVETAPVSTARHLRPVRAIGRIVARSTAMLEVVEAIDRFAPTDVSLTLTGETGTGKDVLAHVVHKQSPRASGPFVVFDCGAVATNLAESELFGHERGAFTGAVSSHAGAVERAHGGTLFLDEIGELPIDLQPRLLRVLESRRVRRVGGVHDRPFDVRIVAATHRDLRADVAAGRFRQDLYFRLGGAIISVPPLRERLEDLPVLVQNLLDDLGRPELRAADATLCALRSHLWPGNVRELKNALACAAAFAEAETGLIEPRHLRLQSASHLEPSSLERLPLGGRNLEHIERAAIKQTLAQMAGNKVRSAEALGIAVSTLYEKLRKYQLSEEQPGAATRRKRARKGEAFTPLEAEANLGSVD